VTRTNITLTTVLLVVVLLTFATRVDYSRPNFEILPDMKYSPASTAYTPSSVFPNGRTLQAPVAGTIPRGQMPLHYAATKEDAIRAGEELANPFQTSESEDEAQQLEQLQLLQKSIGRGAETYRVVCVSCHGAEGAGDGLIAKRGFPRGPRS
jgi:mono/diheme cytochrome c family protein